MLGRRYTARARQNRRVTPKSLIASIYFLLFLNSDSKACAVDLIPSLLVLDGA
jgi:hypothetical protein